MKINKTKHKKPLRSVTQRNKFETLKIYIIGDILLNEKSFEHLVDVDKKFTYDKEVLATYTDEEIFSVLLCETQNFLAENEVIRKTEFLQNCYNAFVDVLKYVTMQQKIDCEVLLNYLYSLMVNERATIIAKRSRVYIDNYPKTNHTYNLTGKSITAINMTLDRALTKIIRLEAKENNIIL